MHMIVVTFFFCLHVALKPVKGMSVNFRTPFIVLLGAIPNEKIMIPKLFLYYCYIFYYP